MFCSHNEVDLEPYIDSVDGTDWAVVRCKACSSLIGTKIRLLDLVQQAIKRAKDARSQLDALDIDWELDDE